VTPALEVVGLVKRFPGHGRAARDGLALAGVDLSVAPGEVRGLVGPNGAGKSTLLRLAFGLLRPDAGSVRLLGRSIAEDGQAALTGVAGFADTPRFHGHRSAQATLTALAALDGRTGAAGRTRVDEALASVDLTDRARERVAGFSTGLRQRLGIAAALLRRPRLLLLDEPTSGLDPVRTTELHALVGRLAADGVAVVISSHDLVEVDLLCHSLTVLRGGQVAFDGTAAALHDRAPDPVHRLRTGDDVGALAVPAPTGVTVTPAAAGGLLVRAGEDGLAAYLLGLAGPGSPPGTSPSRRARSWRSSPSWWAASPGSRPRRERRARRGPGRGRVAEPAEQGARCAAALPAGPGGLRRGDRRLAEPARRHALRP